MQFDLLIANGKVFDGSGAEGFAADVGLVDERIAVIGALAGTYSLSRKRRQ